MAEDVEKAVSERIKRARENAADFIASMAFVSGQQAQAVVKRYFENRSHQKNFRLILIFPLSRDLPLEGRFFPVAPVKTVLPIPKLVRGLKKTSGRLNYSPFP
ncbi:MAG: hypothetical protein U0N00_05555 [Oscillospiraceae bacterium]